MYISNNEHIHIIDIYDNNDKNGTYCCVSMAKRLVEPSTIKRFTCIFYLVHITDFLIHYH